MPVAVSTRVPRNTVCLPKAKAPQHVASLWDTSLKNCCSFYSLPGILKQMKDCEVLRTNDFLLLKSDRSETASSFKGWKTEKKDAANDFSKADTFELDSPC